MFPKAFLPLLLLLLNSYTGTCNEQNLLVSHSGNEEPEPTWVYQCLGAKGCQRFRPSQTLENASVFPNLNLCRSVCGSFGGIWPRPHTAVLSKDTLPIHPQNIRYDVQRAPIPTQELLLRMTHITTDNLVAECGGNVTEFVDTPVMVYINVKSDDIELTWDTNEMYILDLQTRGSRIVLYISAETVYGARHALETFTQLVSSTKDDFSNQKSCGLRVIAKAKIRDEPVYSHRGLLLDTARNFVPLEDIKRTIKGMAATKMNVFHWHATDSQSFPLESLRVPQFTRYGAYSPSSIYRANEIKELVEYARERGVRVVIEIDSPAHAGNGWQWGKEHGLDDLAVCVNAEQWRTLCIQPPCGQLNPANPSMYHILRDLYRDMAEVLPRPALLHMGGDEVFIPCWNSSKQIVSYMTGKGYELNTEGFIRLWAEFHEKALQIWDEELRATTGQSPQPVLLWSSELTQPQRIRKYLNSDRYVIEVWEVVESALLSELIDLGYRVISVPKNVWYLDHGFWGITKYANWRKMYSHYLPKEDNVLGGEVAMWSEYVDTQGLDTRVWPRAAAVAERLWSNPASSAESAEPRLQRLRSRLIARGIKPDVLSPAWCQQNDNRCR